MKKILIPFLLTLLALTGCGDNSTPKEGVEYTTIKTPLTNTSAPVIEVFSLACGHCRNMETILPEIQKMTDSDIQQVHVTFNKSAQVAAYIYYTAVIQSEGHPDPKLMEQLFAYIQDTPAELDETARKAKLMGIFKDFQLKSPFELSEEQHKQVYQQLTKAETVVENAEIVSVPAFLVQGKYLVKSEAHESLEDLASTIQYLKQL